MRSLLLLIAIAIPSYVFSLPTNDDSNLRPNFEGKRPKSVENTNVQLRAGIDPPNCAIGWIHDTDREGDGAPKKWTFWKQISVTIDCNLGQCTVNWQSSTDYTIGFSASAPITRWISGGFNVEMSSSTGNTYECTGGQGQSVCIWIGTWHYAYSVRNIRYPMDPRCGRMTTGPTVRVTSPWKGGEGKRLWCGFGDSCRKGIGAEEWTENWHGE